MTRNLLLLLTLLVLSPAVCLAGENSSPGADPTTGIEGTITLGPTHGGPVREGESSSAPLANVSFDVKEGDKVIASFQTDGEGHFKVLLPPGHYTVARRERPSAIGHYGPFEVTVTSGKMTSVQWDCDTGMR